MHHNHVGKLIWCINNEAQEINRTIYCHKPIVQRWTTPSSWRWWWCWRRRGWRSVRGRLRQCFPLQSLLEQPLFMCFMFLHRLISRSFLGQAEHQETKMDGIGIRRLKRAWVVWPAGRLRHLGLFGPWASSRWLLDLQQVLLIKY
jgi:hypothetical protein